MHFWKNYTGKSEVIIVDDSVENESVQIRRLCKDYGCRYNYFQAGVSAKRNYGVRMSENEIILFLDSDCIVTEHIIEEYARKYANDKTAAVAGPLEFVGLDTWFWKAIEATPYLTCFYLPRFLPKVEWGVTANFSCRKDVFLKVGGFDETFRRPAGEDVDLGLRIRKSGHEILGASDALVYHSKKTWIPVRAMFRRLHYYGHADCDLIIRHPDRGETVLPKRVFLYFIYAILLMLNAIIKRNYWITAAIPLLIFAENVAVSILVNKLSNEKRASFLQQLVAQMLIHDSEFSYVERCVTTRHYADIRKQMIYYPGQYSGLLNIGSYVMWVEYICFAVIIAFSILS